MEVITMPVEQIKPYERNTKAHSSTQIKNVAESIKQYGWTQPIVIDRNGVIVVGHCRYAAAKRLKLKEVPTVCVDQLTEEQVNALRIVDNKTNESAWDKATLKLEMPKLDLSPFDFSLDFKTGIDREQQHEKNLEEAQHRRANILNLDKGQFYGDNPFDIPQLTPVYDLPEIEEWIDFDYVLREKEPEKKAVHFFCDDYKFERIWRQPERYVDKLRQFACVATPDFSPYGDMPLIAQLWNHYRKHWVGAFLQDSGVTVIPTIRSSSDPRSFEWFLMGEPKGGIVLTSSMWTKGDEENAKGSAKEYEMMKEVLQPCKIFVYGDRGNMGIKDEDNVEYIENWTQKRWNK